MASRLWWNTDAANSPAVLAQAGWLAGVDVMTFRLGVLNVLTIGSSPSHVEIKLLQRSYFLLIFDLHQKNTDWLLMQIVTCSELVSVHATASAAPAAAHRPGQ
jgi:hypothetical protein